MQGINDLGFPTINGLKSLNLDELETTILNANTIDGNIIYYNRIEGNEIIVDTKLTLTNSGVIAVGDKFISDIELTYLDGVSSNIQTQINNIANQESNVQSQIDTHTSQITSLQATDVTHSNQIGYLQDETADLYNSEAMFIAQIGVLQSKTFNITSANSTSTNMNKPLYITSVDALRLYGNHGYISGWSNGTNTRDWYFGTENANIKRFVFQNERLEGIYFRSGSRTGNTNLGQNKIFTYSNGISLRRGGLTVGDAEVISGEIGATNSADSHLRINGNGTNNIVLDAGLGVISLLSSTSMTKPLSITTNAECLRTIGDHTYWSGFNVTNTIRHFAIGKETASSNRLMMTNYTLGETVIQAGSRTGNTNLGQNKIITNSNGISLRRGGITAGDTQIIVGEIGALTDGNLRINGTSTNNIILSSGIGEINCESNLLRVGATTANANGRKSNILMYDATGNNWETQSSAFTETLKSQISTNASNITILQTSNSSLNSSITLLQEDMLDLQNTENAQSAQLAELQLSDSSQNTKITTLETNTRFITAPTTSEFTVMSKPLRVYANEGIRMYGSLNNISSWDSTANTRDWYVGNPNFLFNKELRIVNEKNEGIHLRTGSSSVNTNLGHNKIITHSTGISFRRGGISGGGDNLVTGGEIGLTEPLDTHFRINGNSTNNIVINAGIGRIHAYANNLLLDSSPINSTTGRKSNLMFYDKTGTAFETQCSAFTEEMKDRLFSLTKFNNNTGKIEFVAASFWWLNLAYNLTQLQPSIYYIHSNNNAPFGAEMSVGSWLAVFGYPNMFDASGAYLYNDKPNLTLIFEMEFTSSFSDVLFMYSQVIVKNNAGTVLSETFESGPHYNSYGRNTLTYKYNYSTAPLRHILNQGDRIFVKTKYNFLTPNSATIDGVLMKGKFSMHAN